MRQARDEAETTTTPNFPAAELVSDYLDAWLLASRRRIGGDLKSSTWRAYKLHIERHLKPRLHGKLIDLDRAMLGAVYDELEETGAVRSNRGLSRKTVWNIHLTLHRALEDAVRDGLLTRNPADGAYTKPKTHVETRAWDAEELGTFIRATADDRLAALWRVAAMTGMRRGEILGLRWIDVDIDQGTLAVVQARVRGDGAVETTSPKTDRGRRSIDVDPITVNHLKRHRKRQIADRLETGPAWTETDLVFTRTDGVPLDPDVVSQTFNRIVKDTELHRIRFHDLRHTQATLGLKSGEPAHVVSRRLGHASEAFTLKQYAHVLPGQQREAALRFAELIDGDGSPSARHQNLA
jgi:integrase